jgi:hypothetical protein
VPDGPFEHAGFEARTAASRIDPSLVSTLTRRSLWRWKQH